MMFPVIPMIYRARAREVLKKNFSTALMVSFLAALPGLLTQVYQAIASRDLMEMLRYHILTFADAVYAGAADSTLMNMLSTAVNELFGAITPALELSMVLSLVAALISPVFTLGLIAHLLKLVRGQTGETADVISRLGCFLKAIWQSILIVIKTLLWTLPGFAVGMVAMVIYALLGTNMGSFIMLYYVGVALSMVLMIRAMLHYSMSSFILADEPSVGAYASIKRSTSMMRTHKMDLFRVYFSFILWRIAANWASTMLGALIPVLGTMSSLAFQLILGLYINTTIVIFYLNMKGEISMVPHTPDLSQMTEDWTSKDDDDDELN